MLFGQFKILYVVYHHCQESLFGEKVILGDFGSNDSFKLNWVGVMEKYTPDYLTGPGCYPNYPTGGES